MFIRNSVVTKTPFPKSLLNIDPALGELVDSLLPEHKKVNWGILLRQFRKFGIQMSSEIREKLCGGDKKEIVELLRFLVIFEKSGGSEIVSETLQISNDVGASRIKVVSVH